MCYLQELNIAVAVQQSLNGSMDICCLHIQYGVYALSDILHDAVKPLWLSLCVYCQSTVFFP